MSGQLAIVLLVLILAAAIVASDVLFLQHRFWARLAVNIALVLLFGAFYFRFVKRR